MNPLAGVRIECVEAGKLTGTRPRVVGRNARLGVHGQVVTEPVVRLRTNVGVTGVGWSRAKPEDAQRLVGKQLTETFDPAKGTLTEYRAFDFPLWDLAAKALDQPVHQLLGGKGSERAIPYDGSIYFDDLDAETGRDLGDQVVLDEIRHGKARGFRAFKLKIGRGNKWMEKSAGFARDVEIIQKARELLGPSAMLLIDANSGYSPEDARQLMRQVDGANLHWFEEPFPEDARESAAFRRFMAENGWKTLLADGEGASEKELEFTAIVREGGVDVVQFDMRSYGLTRWFHYSRQLAELKAQAAPHNWASRLATFYIAHAVRGLPRFQMVEVDFMSMPEAHAEGYALGDGCLTVPDRPGFGVGIDESVFAQAFWREQA